MIWKSFRFDIFDLNQCLNNLEKDKWKIHTIGVINEELVLVVAYSLDPETSLTERV